MPRNVDRGKREKGERERERESPIGERERLRTRKRERGGEQLKLRKSGKRKKCIGISRKKERKKLDFNCFLNIQLQLKLFGCFYERSKGRSLIFKLDVNYHFCLLSFSSRNVRIHALIFYHYKTKKTPVNISKKC